VGKEAREVMLQIIRSTWSSCPQPRRYQHQVVARIRNTEKNQKLAQKTIAACFRFYVEDNDDDDVFRRELGIAFTRAEQWALAEIAAM